MYTGFGCGNLRERVHLENLGLGGRVSTCDSKKTQWRVYRSDLAQDSEKWRALV